nr:ATP-binding protein [uncultured Prevotella sp.]
MISFFEKELNSYVKPYQLNFTSLEVNNKLILPNDGSGILSESILYQPQITLNHNHSIITVNFSLSNYVSVLRNLIYYKLEGFDKEWMSAGYRKGITYTNLNPGKYKLIIKSSEEYSGRESICKEINIVIKPPFYKSAWAYCLYGIIIIISIYIIVSFYSSKLKLRASLEYEKKEKKQIEELNQSKLRFFTNISHEFRTPLTLIVSQLEMLMERNDIQPLVYGKLVGIHRNTLRMKRLITELLDFRKQEQGFEKFKYSKQDIYSFLDEIYLSFKEYARGKQIIFEYFNKDRSLDVWFDVVQLEKVIYNLLSNAFKYTPLGGTVSLSVQEYENSVMILISDTGIGIAEENLNKIFDRFYQANNGQTKAVATRGTGIGLALVKNIVERHHGTINVVSSEEYGSVFVVQLCKDSTQFAADEIESVEAPIDEPLVAEEAVATEGMAKVLVVEDNDELLATLRDIFSPLYHVVVAHNGKEGLDMTRAESPDIVVSDVMMPVMDGMAMCKAIKSDISVSHTLVLLLTAMSASEHEVEGLRCGADDYVAKPFNPSVLLARVAALLRMRSLLQQRFSKGNMRMAEAQQFAVNMLDREFMQRCDEIFNEHIADSDFSVDDMARQLLIGHTSFFTKFKAITSLTPNEYLIKQRLSRAADYLRDNPTSTIANAAYKYGFNSPRYFSQCFKKAYGANPTEWRESFSN